MLILIAIALLVASPVVARLVGHAVARRLGVTPGAAGARMPRLPDEEGFSRGRRKLLKWLVNHPKGVDVNTAAAAVHLTPERVEAWLEGLALRLPSRVQITRRGRALYDFDPAALSQELRRDRARGFLRPFAWAGLALLNVGAAWPLLFSIALVAGGLATMRPIDTFVWTGLTILLGVAVVAASVVGASALVGWLVGPSAPPEPEMSGAPAPETRALGAASRETRRQAVIRRASRREQPAAVLDEPKRSRGWDFAKLLDDPRALLAVVVGVLLLAVVGSALVGLYAWATGLWRSLSGRQLKAEAMGPAAWVRDQPIPGTVERLVPTSDMVGRSLRALRATLRRPRPADGELADRVAALLRQGQGRLGALDLALAEGLDPDDAVEVVTRICVRHNGRLAVTPAGDLVAFVPAFARGEAANVGSGLEVQVGEQGVIVSLPGLVGADRAAASRLAGGTLLLAVGAIWFCAAGPGLWPLVGVAAALVSVMMTSLAAAIRHALAAYRPVARLRDARRHAGRLLLQALSAEQNPLTLRILVEAVEQSLPLAAEVSARHALRVEAAAFLESLEIKAESLREPLDLSGLAARRAAIQALPAPAREGPDDEVIFDTERWGGLPAGRRAVPEVTE